MKHLTQTLCRCLAVRSARYPSRLYRSFCRKKYQREGETHEQNGSTRAQEHTGAPRTPERDAMGLYQFFHVFLSFLISLPAPFFEFFVYLLTATLRSYEFHKLVFLHNGFRGTDNRYL